MKKNLSKVLCEKCGIISTSCMYAQYGYEGEEGTWYFCKKNNEECWTYPRKDLTGCKDLKESFIDFETNSNNFIKLLELGVHKDTRDKTCTLVSLVNEKNPLWTNRQEYINTVLTLLTDVKIKQTIIDAIQKEKWDS